MHVFEYATGSVPLIISMPHSGSFIPEDIHEQMTKEGQKSKDTDWFVEQLYAFAKARGVYWLQSNYSRYVIDLNRSPDDVALYPGRDTTELCPTSTFDKAPIYQHNNVPNHAEIASRITNYWLPYHQQLQNTISEITNTYGFVIVLEAHTIASRVPRFFTGQLSDFNFGTNNGQSCTAELLTALKALDFGAYSVVFDGTFKGGYITRHYAKPHENIFTIQLELSQAVYMNEETSEWSASKAGDCEPYLVKLIDTLLNWSPQAK